jgi:hypothetical protein
MGLLVAAAVLLGHPATHGSESLQLKLLSPRAAHAPAWLVVRTSVEVDADNRALEVSAESDSYFRSSRVPLDGSRAPRFNEFIFRDLPVGEFQVTATLIGTRGQRAVQSRWFIVAGQRDQ